MIATYIDISGNSYDLPKKTLKISKMIDEAYKSTVSEESYKKQYKFVCEVLGPDVANKMLDGTSINDIALDDLTIVFKGIENAYLKSVNEFNANLEAETLNNPAINKIIEMSKSIENINKIAEHNKK